MISLSNHQFFAAYRRDSQPLSNDRCQNILYRTVFEHFIELERIAVLLLASKSFQNSSFGADFVINYVVDEDSILLLNSVLSPSACFSMQFVPSLQMQQWKGDSEKSKRGISNFVSEIVKTKYFCLSLRSLQMYSAVDEVLSCFFGNTSTAWPQLQDLSLEYCRLNDDVMEIIAKNAAHLRAINFFWSPEITDAGREHIAKLDSITSLNLTGCKHVATAGLAHISNLCSITSLDLRMCSQITEAGFEHVAKLSAITSLDLTNCGKINDAALQHIALLTNLTSLNLLSCKAITEAGLEHVAKLFAITSLDLSFSTKINDAGIEHLVGLTDIISLNLAYCNLITDAGLVHLSKLSNITSLDVSFCSKITDDAKNQLMTEIPKCTING